MEEGKQVLCAHRLTRSWDRGGFTAEPIAAVLAQFGPGCVSLSQTFPKVNSRAQRSLLRGHLGANASFLEPGDFGAGSWLQAVLTLGCKSWGKSPSPLRLHVCSSKIRGFAPNGRPGTRQLAVALLFFVPFPSF